MTKPASINVVICTCNRASDLAQTLAAIGQVRVPAGLTAELLIVDNASTDGTAALVQNTSLSNMPVRYVLEPRQGQCYARNTGMARAQGDIILFTDDDVRPPADWIAGMCAPILSGEADAVQGGVRMAPHLQRGWMLPIHRSFVADTIWWDKSEVKSLIGANMAFSKKVLSMIPAFDTELGPGALGFMDDSLFYHQLMASEHTIVPRQDVCVEHHFDASRLSRASLLASCAKLGRSSAYVLHHWDHGCLPTPRRRLVRRRLRLAYHRKWRGVKWTHTEGAPEWEMLQVLEIAMLEQFIREQTRPRNYARHGLVKTC